MEQYITAGPAPDGRIKAAENETRVLRALARFGWLSAKNLAALLWQPWAKIPPTVPNLQAADATASGLRMAQRTLKRLLARNDVLRAPAPGGHVIYALAEAGARRLQSIGVPASTGKDLIRSFSSAHFVHRYTANLIAIRGLVEGFRVNTEREIAQGRWIGGADGVHGKKPDGLLRAKKEIWWIEVEKSRKNAKDYTKLLAWLHVVRKDILNADGPKLLGPGVRWAKVVFISTPQFQSKLVKDLAVEGWKETEINSFLLFDTKLLYRSEDTFFM